MWLKKNRWALFEVVEADCLKLHRFKKGKKVYSWKVNDFEILKFWPSELHIALEGTIIVVSLNMFGAKCLAFLEKKWMKNKRKL